MKEKVFIFRFSTWLLVIYVQVANDSISAAEAPVKNISHDVLTAAISVYKTMKLQRPGWYTKKIRPGI